LFVWLVGFFMILILFSPSARLSRADCSNASES
jgi:hypothetical protein